MPGLQQKCNPNTCNCPKETGCCQLPFVEGFYRRVKAQHYIKPVVDGVEMKVS